MEFLHRLVHRLSHGANAPNLAFLLLLASLIVAPMLAGLVRLPAMVGLVLVGMLIGPHGLGILASKRSRSAPWGNFGLLYLMFNGGPRARSPKLFAQ